MRRLRFTRTAVQDMARLRTFIADENPQAAARVGRRLRNTINRLAEQPRLGRPLEELPGVRELVIGDYIIRYTVMDEVVVMLRIWHGKEER